MKIAVPVEEVSQRHKRLVRVEREEEHGREVAHPLHVPAYLLFHVFFGGDFLLLVYEAKKK